MDMMANVKRINMKDEHKNFMSGLSWVGQKVVD